MVLSDLSRRDVRYWCFRFQTEINDGTSSKGAPRGLKRCMEHQEEFRGWREFAKSWDVSLTQPLVVVERYFSVWEQWEAKLKRNVSPLPATELKNNGSENNNRSGE